MRRGDGVPHKPFSWLSEGVRGMFTTNTEAGEKLVSPSTSSGHHVHVVASAGQYCLDLSLVTVVVTTGRRLSCRVVL